MKMLAALASLLAACTSPPSGADRPASPGPAPDLRPHAQWARWLEGAEWIGTRTDADGSVAALTLSVRPLLGGAAFLEELRIAGDTGSDDYHGLHVLLLDRERGLWVRHYANAVRGHFVALEARPGPGPTIWIRAPRDGTGRSRLVEEAVEPDLWRRTQEVSEDGGSTWRVRFFDELRPAAP